ncbi:MAG: DUF1902 domain-containing protein [Selenomonadaceae bacterium]|nr:DUF1902 domain-containing protein [Selenomonadaceae bacterium]
MNVYEVKIFWDDEAEVWIAVCDEIPLALESESLDELINRVKLAAPEIIEMNNLPSRDLLFTNMKQSNIDHHFYEVQNVLF